jgi:hypothetical protein
MFLEWRPLLEALVDGSTPGSVDVSSQGQPIEVYILIQSFVNFFTCYGWCPNSENSMWRMENKVEFGRLMGTLGMNVQEISVSQLHVSACDRIRTS